jgi:hypothetical protein
LWFGDSFQTIAPPSSLPHLPLLQTTSNFSPM